MNMKKNDIIMQNKIFAWIALVTGLILTAPYMAMQFEWVVPDPGNPADQGVNWTPSDFVIMGTLIFATASLFVVVARRTERRYRWPIALAFLIGFFCIWVELAVGAFTNLID